MKFSGESWPVNPMCWTSPLLGPAQGLEHPTPLQQMRTIPQKTSDLVELKW